MQAHNDRIGVKFRDFFLEKLENLNSSLIREESGQTLDFSVISHCHDQPSILATG